MKYKQGSPMKRHLAALALAACLSAGLTSCAVKTPTAVSHPNQINAIDGGLYDTLITAQAALNGLKAQASTFPQFKTQLNQAIAAYDAAQAAYKVYHAAGVADPNKQANLNVAVAQAIAQIAALVKAFGGVKTTAYITDSPWDMIQLGDALIHPNLIRNDYTQTGNGGAK